jgi:hypothetical protein
MMTLLHLAVYISTLIQIFYYVNSLRNKTELISTELGNHDIICITESRLNNTVSSSDITIDNFINPEAFRKDRLTDSGGGIHGNIA